MLSFDWKQKKGALEGRGEIWVVWGAAQWGRCFSAGLVFYNRGGAGANGLMMETIPLIQAHKRIFCPTRSQAGERKAHKAKGRGEESNEMRSAQSLP